MKSAKLEWALDALPEALTLVQEGLTKFQDSDKLWMMKGQLQVGWLKKTKCQNFLWVWLLGPVKKPPYK